MIYPLSQQLQQYAIKHPLVSMSSVGDIMLYEDKTTIKYPYVNFDVISSQVNNFIKTYNFRIYVMDINQQYIAYNKCEVILDDVLKDLQVDSYTIQYLTLKFTDMVDGVFADFQINQKINGTCVYNSLFSNILLEEGGFVLQENGDLIII